MSSNVVYLNGSYLPLADASVNVEDRGFMFADGVYEVVRYYGGRPLAMREHLERLRLSLDAVRIKCSLTDHPLDAISDELVRHNDCPDATIYWQVTRGVAPRTHTFPAADTRPTVLAIAYRAQPLSTGPIHRLTAIVRPEVRWRHCVIKSLSLLPNVLDSQAAADAGCDLAVLVRDDQVVTEAPSRSIIIVEGDTLITHPLDGRILDSITRRITIELAKKDGLNVVEEYYPLSRLMGADEVLAVGSTTEVATIVRVHGKPIAEGEPGPIGQRLLDLYQQHVIAVCGLRH